jgi:hypothetical protein
VGYLLSSNYIGSCRPNYLKEDFIDLTLLVGELVNHNVKVMVEGYYCVMFISKVVN